MNPATEPVYLEVSTEAAAFVNSDAPHELRMLAARGESDLQPGDFSAILYYLCHDEDNEVSSTAIRTMQDLPVEKILSELTAAELHPAILDIFARLYFNNGEIAELIALHPATGMDTLGFLSAHGIEAAVDACAAESGVRAAIDTGHPLDIGSDEEGDEEIPDEEEYHSKYQLAQTMGVADKVKAALTGDKEWRTILIKDSNKMVSGAVIKNPRITDAEVLNIVKTAVQNDEIIRSICVNKEWIKIYKIRKALVENSKTPLPFALRFLGSLTEKDLAALSKSKNVSSVIVSQARRALLNMKKHS